MPKFRVRIRQDAWIFHDCVLDASSREDACETAIRAWKEGDENTVKFEDGGITDFDHIECDPEDDVEEISSVDPAKEALESSCASIEAAISTLSAHNNSIEIDSAIKLLSGSLNLIKKPPLKD